MKQETGLCQKCNQTFKYYLIHNGFNESTYAYCNLCGKTLFLYENSTKIIKNCKWFFNNKNRYEKIDKRLETHLKKCSCGGRFLRSAKPRCPHCGLLLSARQVGVFIENNSIGTKKGWHWQKNWNGLYAIVINGNAIQDNWKVQKLLKKGDSGGNSGDTHHN